MRYLPRLSVRKYISLNGIVTTLACAEGSASQFLIHVFLLAVILDTMALDANCRESEYAPAAKQSSWELFASLGTVFPAKAMIARLLDYPPGPTALFQV